MPTQYFVLSDKQAAKAQSADWWTKILGRAKNPGDVTEFLFECIDNPIDGKNVIVVVQEWYDRLYPLLNAQQKAFCDANIKQENDPYIIAWKLAVYPPNSPANSP